MLPLCVKASVLSVIELLQCTVWRGSRGLLDSSNVGSSQSHMEVLAIDV